MFAPLRQMFRARPEAARPTVPAGERYYVIGDIHGRLDLLTPLAEAIEADASTSSARSTVILLGDLVDRGADSAGVIAYARAWQQRRPVRILAGNHEQMFLESFGSTEVLREFLKHGGRETVLSYGIDPDTYRDATLPEVQALMADHIPAADIAFVEGFESYVEAGDYLFVHAGIQPGVPLDEQQRSDMLWIRRRFIEHDAPHSHYVIHGHTISETIDQQHNRMGIDTGAYRTGRLTALALEGTARRLIQAVETDGRIAIETGDRT